MAGVKGRSGGARPNTGGARAGAGRKPSKPSEESANKESVLIEGMDMLEMLQAVALGRTDANALQVRAAIAAVQYTHRKMADGGVKEQKQEAAKKIAGRFASAAPPRLAAQGGKKV